MPSPNISRSGLRASLMLAISILCLFAFQQLPGWAPNIAHNLASVHNVNHKSATTPTTHATDQLPKRVAIPFGDEASAYNFSTPPDHPDLIKRANSWSLSFGAAVCKGRKLYAQIQASSGGGRKWTVDQMTQTQGWNLNKPVLQPLPDPLKTALGAHGIALTDLVQRNGELEKPFTNDAGETVQNDCGYYRNASDVTHGAIVAIDNAAPTFCVNVGVDPPLKGAAMMAAVPPLNRWSDVVWTLWSDLAGEQASSLRYIFRDNVLNEDSKHVMDVAMGLPNDSPGTGTLDAPWPGKTFSIVNGDLEAFALLGTPHGNGISWFLIDHQEVLGKKNDIRITCYTGRGK